MILPKHTRIALALGSNLGDRAEVLRKAVQEVGAYVTVVGVSSVYETAAAYVRNQPAFLNAALIGDTEQEPIDLLRIVKGVETKLGRLPTFHYGPRVVDIDIIFYGNQIIDLPSLSVPHLRMVEREFVLRPLADIAPFWKHPQSGLTVAEMLNQIPSENPVCLGGL